MSYRQRIFCITEGMNVFKHANSPLTTCPNDVNHTINELSKSEIHEISCAAYGGGIDGNITISANTTLTRDAHYYNLIITNGAILNTGGYRVFVTSTLNLINGVIERNGGNAIGGIGGVGSCSRGTCGHGTGGAQGVISGNGITGSSITENREGGLGGAGASNQSSSGGAGGHGPRIRDDAGKSSVLNCALIATRMSDLNGRLIAGGTGGGSGAAFGGLSGAGGGGGGAILIAAREIICTVGSINAVGGAGGASPTETSGSGGGGGGGFIVIVSSHDIPAELTISVTGGNGGVGGYANGSSGSPGQIFTNII